MVVKWTDCFVIVVNRVVLRFICWGLVLVVTIRKSMGSVVVAKCLWSERWWVMLFVWLFSSVM